MIGMSNIILKIDPSEPNNIGWTKKGFIWQLVPNNRLVSIGVEHGYANGYVALPVDHIYYGVEYEEIPIKIHCGLTYGQQHNDWWVLGFDTCHGGDNLENWNRENCYNEVMKLVKQCEDVYKGVAYARNYR